MSSIADSKRFPEFKADPTATLLQNFKRLAIEQQWEKKSKKYKKQQRAYLADAVEAGFLTQYGRNAESLQAWQNLCKTVGVPPRRGTGEEVVLTSIQQCRDALKGVFVNLVDLVEAGYRKTVVKKTFGSRKKLADYIIQTGKVYPCERAKANPFLVQFLILVGGRINKKGKKSKGRKPKQTSTPHHVVSNA